MVLRKHYIILILFAFTLTSCTSYISARRDISTISELKDNQVLVVGKIELIPELHKDQQYLINKNIAGELRNSAYVLFDDKTFDMSKLSMGSIGAASFISLNKTFFIPVDRGKAGDIIYSGSMIITNDKDTRRRYRGAITAYIAQRLDHYILPGILKYNVGRSDRAIYIGTIQYYRDEYDAITKVKIKDEFEQAKAEVEKRFKQVTLRKVTHY